jgi:NADH-quinone oxidoreductase subunit G
MAKIVVDGIEYEVNPDNNLLHECLSQGLDLPYFCWHPCMGSVGACRQCAVKQYRDADDEEGLLVMACMTPATDGTIISINNEIAKSMRARVIESLMISHPHDCPVCEEGGECHLQDMTLMSGHNYRRYDKNKVTHRNQYLGPFINHEMNRCITCYRCVRFYDDYAGGSDLSAQASHHHTYFGRLEDGVLESEFSGNLVEVCPTGVFTDKPFSKHYARKWDLQTGPSVCTGCAVGCNTTPGERYGELRRIVNRYNSEVNGYFICDRGRFGFDYINSNSRFTVPTKHANGKSSSIDGVELQALLNEFRDGGYVGIGSPRASNESNFALRSLVGETSFYSGLADIEHEALQLILKLGRDKAFHSSSVREIEKADAVVVLGEDLTNVAPRIALALRQSVRNKAQKLAKSANIPHWQDAAVRELAQNELGPLAILSSYVTRLDDLSSDSVIDAPSVLADIGFAIAARLSGEAPDPPNFDSKFESVVDRIQKQLSQAERPLIIAGSTAGTPALIQAAANIARALHVKQGQVIDLCLIVPEVNTIGVSLLANENNKLGDALEKMNNGSVKKVIIIENDLYRRADQYLVNNALSKLETLVVIDQLPNATTEPAHVVIPSTGFSEHEATYVNYEGRAQLSFQVHRNPSEALPAWRWLTDTQKGNVEVMINRCAKEAKSFDKLDTLLPNTQGFAAGMKVPRQLHRYSGRTATEANLNVHEPKQPVDDQSVLAFSMEGIPSAKDSTILSATWSPQWNSNQSISKFQDEINGELKQGNTGALLIERTETNLFYPAVSHTPNISKGALKATLAYQIFGSDELSARSESIQQRMTEAYVGLSPQDAKARGLEQGDLVRLDGNDDIAIVCIRSRIEPGTAAVYCGDNQLNAHSLGAGITIRKAEGLLDNRTIKGLIISDLYEGNY